MDKIAFDDDEYLFLGWHSPSWWFKWVSFVASLISLLLALYLLYRVHVLGSALSLIHTARAQQIPRELFFSKPDTNLENNMGNDSVTSGIVI